MKSIIEAYIEKSIITKNTLEGKTLTNAKENPDKRRLNNYKKITYSK
jgi:hypothetical protein